MLASLINIVTIAVLWIICKRNNTTYREMMHSFTPTVFDMKFIIYRFLSFLPLTIWICFQYYKDRPISYIMTGHWILNIATTIQIVITSFHPETYTMLIK